MINTILLVNDCELTNDGFSGQAFTLAAGVKPTEKDAETLDSKIDYGSREYDYLVLSVTMESTRITAMPGDMILINDDCKLTVVCNPSPEFTKSVIENSGLEVHNTKYKSFD